MERQPKSWYQDPDILKNVLAGVLTGILLDVLHMVLSKGPLMTAVVTVVVGVCGCVAVYGRSGGSFRSLWSFGIPFLILAFGGTLFLEKKRSEWSSHPSITISKIPPAGFGSDQMAEIEGIVKDSPPGANHAVAIYSYVQMPPGRDPWTIQPVTADLTSIGKDGAWRARIHLGSRYAAILVKSSYRPPHSVPAIPAISESVLDVAIVDADTRK
jgi:hypothetical protein